jgi:hypothetical protein
MPTLTKPTAVFTMTESDILAMIAAQGEAPPDLLTRHRAKLYQLPTVARRVYPRENLVRKNEITLTEVVETVFYHFDPDNRHGVARGLGMEYEDMMLLLAGFILAIE